MAIFNENSEASSISSAPASGTISTTINENKVSNELSMVAVAGEMVNVVKDILYQDVLSYTPRVYTAQVVEQVDDNHYNLRVISSTNENTIPNIVNQTRFDLTKGDYVQILDTMNNLSTSFIIAKMNVPVVSITGALTTIDTTENIPEDKCILRYKGNRWYLLFGADVFSDIKFSPTPIYDESGESIIKIQDQAIIQVNILRLSRDDTWDNLNGYITINRGSEETVDYIRIFDNIAVNKPSIDCPDSITTPAPAVDITEIVNNFIFEDEYRYTEYDSELGYWTKKFGIYISNLQSDGQTETIEWQGESSINGRYIWSDGENIYYSYLGNQYVLNKSTSTWSVKTWSGLARPNALDIWSDGENIYYSNGLYYQYILDKSTSTWSPQTWLGFTDINGRDVWSDGNNIYYSYQNDQYILNTSTLTWVEKTWSGYTRIMGRYIWIDGDNIYYSFTTSYVLDKSTSTWQRKYWNGRSAGRGGIQGDNIWQDSINNIYYSYGPDQYILNKNTSTWIPKTWSGLTSFYGQNIWTDGDNYYCSTTTQGTYRLIPYIWCSNTTQPYSIDVYGDVSSAIYNINNINWSGSTKIQLMGNLTTPFIPNKKYVISNYTYGLFGVIDENNTIIDQNGTPVYQLFRTGDDGGSLFKVISSL